MKANFYLIVFILLTSVHETPKEPIKLEDSGNIPFELTKEKIIIPVQIGGRTYRFLVDTGGIFEISEELQNQFDFNQIESTIILDINRKEVELNTVVVPEINIGDWSFKNRNAIVNDLPHKYPYSCFELDGMIGRDFFDNVLLLFDHATNTFRISRDTDDMELDKSNATRLKLSKRGLPEIKLKINDKTEYIEFDSGSGDFYSPKTSDVEKRLLKTSQGEILAFQGKFSFGVTMEDIKATKRYMEKINSLQLANATYGDFYSQFSKVAAPRIGAGILKYGKVIVDYRNGWFYFEPYSKIQKFEPFKTFGFDVTIENGTYIVKYVLEGSKAQKLGLGYGNKIIMINNVPTINISEDCKGYLFGYDFERAESITMKYLDNRGEERNISLNYQIYE